MKRSDMSRVSRMQRVGTVWRDFQKVFFEDRAGSVGTIRKRVQKVTFEPRVGVGRSGIAPQRGSPAGGASSDNRD